MADDEKGSDMAKPHDDDDDDDGGMRLAIVHEGKLCVRSSSSPSGWGATDLGGNVMITIFGDLDLFFDGNKIGLFYATCL
jgi:hypothetical protein